jgi:O-antigen/teichoic acid export membrane protein
MSVAETSSLPQAAGSPLGEGATRLSSMIRYGVGIAAPASVAIAHFAVQLLLLRHLTPVEFGTFALLMVLIQLGYGVSNALISTPYTVALHDAEMTEGARQSFFSVNAVYALGFGLACAVIGWVFAGGPWIAVFAVYSTMAMMRWFGRAHCYAVFRQLNAAASDLSYAVLLLLFTGGLWYLGRVDLLGVSCALLAATIGSILAIRSGFFARQFGRAAFSSLRPYGRTWKAQSRWSLLGVVTTEATSNAHAYLVSAFAGPAAFAPLAAASLFMRPVALAITSLTQLERPSLSRAIMANDISRARAISRTFLIVLLLIWLAVAALAGAVLLVRPDLIAGQHYLASELQVAFALLAAVALLQSIQTPASVFLQAAREFRMLALASVVASVISILLATAALLAAGPIYSLLGIIAGKAMMTVQVLRRSYLWKPDHE